MISQVAYAQVEGHRKRKEAQGECSGPELPSSRSSHISENEFSWHFK